MKVICSFCRKEICEIEPLSDPGVNYGMCDECHAVFAEKVKDLTLDKVIEEFETPVLVVDEDCRIVASNKLASHIVGLGPSKRDYMGLLGGEAMKCEYADLPEGCGKTYHCIGCTIRNSVKESIEKGIPQKDIPVTLKRKDGEIKLKISTERIFSLVRINLKTDFIPSKRAD